MAILDWGYYIHPHSQGYKQNLDQVHEKRPKRGVKGAEKIIIIKMGMVFLSLTTYDLIFKAKVKIHYKTCGQWEVKLWILGSSSAGVSRSSNPTFVSIFCAHLRDGVVQQGESLGAGAMWAYSTAVWRYPQGCMVQQSAVGGAMHPRSMQLSAGWPQSNIWDTALLLELNGKIMLYQIPLCRSCWENCFPIFHPQKNFKVNRERERVARERISLLNLDQVWYV